MFSAYVSSTAIAETAGYIYIIFSAGVNKALYIGQTRQQLGALGRFSQHISLANSNTFIQRVCAVKGFDSVKLEDVNFFAYRLPDIQCFHGKSRDYREAVEYLVQSEVLNLVCENKIAIPVVSRVVSNPYKRELFVQRASKEIINELQPCLMKLI